MAAPSPPPEAPDRADALGMRWQLIRDLAVFVVKAAIETVRDLVLIPVALAAGVLGLLFQRSRPSRYFREVVELGRRFDRWLNLFGASGSGAAAAQPDPDAGGAEAGIDLLLARVEGVLIEEHRRGGVTTHAKEVIDRALDAIQGAPRAPDSSHDPRGS